MKRVSKVNAKTKSGGVKFEDIKAQLMEDAEFKEEYNKLTTIHISRTK